MESLDRFLTAVSRPLNPWVLWKMDPVKFPIYSYEILFISMMLAIIGYIVLSLLTYRPYDLDKLLHRGEETAGEGTAGEAATIPWKSPAGTG